MKAAALIKMLSKLDPDIEVVVATEDDDHDYSAQLTMTDIDVVRTDYEHYSDPPLGAHPPPGDYKTTTVILLFG